MSAEESVLHLHPLPDIEAKSFISVLHLKQL